MHIWMEVFILSEYGFKQLLGYYYENHPKTVKGLNNISVSYYMYELYNLFEGRFIFDGLPNDENWVEEYIKEVLFLNGVIQITKTEIGIIPIACGLEGYNYMQRPIHTIVANPVLGNFRKTIGYDCEIVWFQHDFMSVIPTLERYASMLANVDGSLETSLINSRVAHVFLADSLKQARNYQKMYDKAIEGNGAVFLIQNVSKDIRYSNIFNNVKNTYIGNDLLITKRSIYNEFLSYIGINNANTDKRERLNSEEVNANNGEVSSRIDSWVEQINQCLEKVNKMFDLNISCRKRELESEVMQDESN